MTRVSGMASPVGQPSRACTAGFLAALANWAAGCTEQLLAPPPLTGGCGLPGIGVTKTPTFVPGAGVKVIMIGPRVAVRKPVSGIGLIVAPINRPRYGVGVAVFVGVAGGGSVAMLACVAWIC